ncbi:MAG: trypsin-like peptidase domain-containing protein, partial [Planctomycetota bacterium]
AALEQALVEAIARAEPSVVAIARVRRDEPGERAGSEFRLRPFDENLMPAPEPQPTDPDFIPSEYGAGVVVDSRGLILTSAKLLADDSDYYVTTRTRQVHRAKIRAADPRSELAVLSIEVRDLSPITFGDGGAVRKGQVVITLGNPYAIARDGQASAGWGIVSNLNRKAPPLGAVAEVSARPTLHHFGTLIQTDAKLNVGASGGPLLNLKGEMIGLVVGPVAAAGYDPAGGYAIPVDETFRRAVDTLKQGREVEYGFLGVQPSSLSAAERSEGAHGMHVERVVPGTPAARHGIAPGDRITHVNSRPIYDADGLILEVGRMPVDSVAKVRLVRHGRPQTVDVVLSKYPVRGRKIVSERPPAWRGLRVDYSTALPEVATGVRDVTAFPEVGVVVTDVEPESSAWKAGARPGMFLSHVAGRPVHSPREFRAAVADRTGPVVLRATDDSVQLEPVQPEG